MLGEVAAVAHTVANGRTILPLEPPKENLQRAYEQLLKPVSPLADVHG